MIIDAPSHGRLQILSTHPPFSFFKLAEKFQDSLPLKRIFSLMRKQNVASIVLETIRPDDEFLEEVRALEKRLSKKIVKNVVTRITFFNIDVSNHGLDKVSSRNCLGSAIFRRSITKDRKEIHNLYEAAIKHPRILNNYIHCFSTFKVRCGNRFFRLKATYFCQQNDKTNVCAHAALKMISHNLQRVNIEPFNYEKINKVLGIDHQSRKLGSGEGLYIREVTKILEGTGLKIKGHSYDTEKAPPYSFQQLIYSAVESGYPALLAFRTADGGGHILPVVGHTFNDDNWLPNAEQDYFHLGDVKYLRSTAWINNFIIHDDNYGAFYCLPIRFFKNEDLIAVFQIFPKEVKEAPIDIELQAAWCLEFIVNVLKPLEHYWLKKLRNYIVSGKQIVRTFLIKKDEYIRSIANEDIEGNTLEEYYIDYLKDNLPATFWISEISLPELFPTNKRKVADIIIDSSRSLNRDDFFETLLFVRVPGHIVIKMPDEINVFSTVSKHHVPLIMRRGI